MPHDDGQWICRVFRISLSLTWLNRKSFPHSTRSVPPGITVGPVACYVETGRITSTRARDPQRAPPRVAGQRMKVTTATRSDRAEGQARS